MGNARNLAAILSGNVVIPADAIGDGNVTSEKLDDNIALPGTGSVKVPSGSEAQRDSGDAGKFRYNTDLNAFEGHNGTSWGTVGGGATGGGSDAVFYLNDQIITENYTVASDKNAQSTGPLVIADGVTVDVDSGGRWIIH